MEIASGGSFANYIYINYFTYRKFNASLNYFIVNRLFKILPSHY